MMLPNWPLKTYFVLTLVLMPAAYHSVQAQDTTGAPLATPSTEVAPAPAIPVPEIPAQEIPIPVNTATAGNLEQFLAERPVVNKALTVEEAVALALRESPVVRGAAEEVEAALGRLNAARAERRPLVTANTFLSGGTMTNIVASPGLPDAGMIMNLLRGGYFDQNLMLMAPLYTGGRLKTLVRQATALRGVAQAELESQRQEVALLTRTAYREVQARRALVEVQQARLRENQEQLRVDRVRAEEGKIPPFLVLRDEAEVAATQQEITNAQRDVELSLVQLRTVLGIHPASQIDVTGVLDYQPSAVFLTELSGATSAGAAGRATPRATPLATPLPAPSPTAPPRNSVITAPLPADLSALLRVAERRRPELQAATLRITSAEAEVAAVSQSYRPQVNAFVMGDIAKSRGQSTAAGTTFGIAASIPIFTGGRKEAAQQSARAESRVRQYERDRVVLEIAQSVNGAYLNLRAAEQNIETARAALRAAQEDYRVMRIRYEAGKSILVELLDALATRVRAEGNVVQALFGYNLAHDQLLRAIGVLESDAAEVVPPIAPSSQRP